MMESSRSCNSAVRRSLAALAALACVVTISGCGRGTKIYLDPAAPGVLTVTGNLRNPLPSGFFDHSVNQGSVDIALDGSTSTSLAPRLQTKAGTSPAGGFNGAATGNRAIFGIGLYSGKKLTEVTSFSFDSKSVNGTAAVGISILVDLDCSGAATRVLSASGAALAPGSAQSNGYTRYSASVGDSKWLVAGSDIDDPAVPATILVPSSGAAVSLTALLGKYPNACLRNDVNSDDSLPKSTATAAVLFTLGDAANIDLEVTFLNRIEIGADVYEGTQWGSL